MEIIKPLIESLNPQLIIELGNSRDTKNILEYSLINNSKLISIDPYPNNSIIELESKYVNNFILIRNLSLNAISDIKNFEIIFINNHHISDVYQELIFIQNNVKDYFPIVVLCYDEYSNVNYNNYDIKLEYDDEDAEKKLIFNMSSDASNSLNNKPLPVDTENKFSNVLEKFINSSYFDLKYLKVDGFQEFLIIYDQKTYIENKVYKRTIDNFKVIKKHNTNYVSKINPNDYELLNRNTPFKNGLSHEKSNSELLEQNNILKNNLKFLNQHIENLDHELEEKNDKIGNLELKLNKVQKKLDQLKINLKTLSYSRKKDFYKNFRILFNEFVVNKSDITRGRLISLTKIPYLYMFLKSKGNIKKAWFDIKSYRTIKRSGLFDEDYYLKTYKNVLVSGINPLYHYMHHGYKENKNPSAVFNGEYYLNKYSDVKDSGMNPLLHYSLYGLEKGNITNDHIKISVIVTTYNHEKYIRQCIDSILMQKDVEIELIVGDDCSDDNTRNILEKYQKQYPKIINLLPKTENLGVTKNIKRCLEAVTGKYVAFCEGDDYWIDPLKLVKQSNYLEERDNCAMCFNSLLLHYEGCTEKNRLHHEHLNKGIFKVHELVLDNFIGNFSCCMYRSDIVKNLPDTLYEFYTVDWMFNIVCSEYGNIGFLPENMSVYRIHEEGLWSSKDTYEQSVDILKNIDIYNEFLSFKYDSEFKKVKERYKL